jgi:hypothetical protein
MGLRVTRNPTNLQGRDVVNVRGRLGFICPHLGVHQEGYVWVRWLDSPMGDALMFRTPMVTFVRKMTEEEKDTYEEYI